MTQPSLPPQPSAARRLAASAPARAAARAVSGAVLATALGLLSAPGAAAGAPGEPAHSASVFAPAPGAAPGAAPATEPRTERSAARRSGAGKPWPVGPATTLPADAPPAGEASGGTSVEAAGDGGWRQGDLALNASDNAAVDAFMARARTAEKDISPQIRTVASWSGAELVGFDQRLKSEDSLKRKIATWLTADPDQTVHEALDGLNDSVRYTLQWEDGAYTDGVRTAAGMLGAWGHESVRWSNTWKNRTGYKGINAAWRDPMHGHTFEVQFHTPASHEAAVATHPLYEEQRLPGTSPERKAELQRQQGRIFAAVPVPAGAPSLTEPAPARPARVPQHA
ncbi:ATP nucleotide 3'-pyrophosphokinase [Streptomyces sp. TRM 70351]|uniref:ATP nucleotide 3'-pyrophosphokinase n=1 Tax=Streptomyces sp. TRM 70351 TaxID=3116552 RepID=UPI002E7ACDA8|nr:ATP nucleotide 3'-pyrophosphokinase [Streptomyces sp. TRM 70351]MEE1929955.1 ATP nucleotide 3'-pyrophosphokinase [Streptomyces sp. TRM 70351]